MISFKTDPIDLRRTPIIETVTKKPEITTAPASIPAAVKDTVNGDEKTSNIPWGLLLGGIVVYFLIK